MASVRSCDMFIYSLISPVGPDSTTATMTMATSALFSRLPQLTIFKRGWEWMDKYWMEWSELKYWMKMTNPPVSHLPVFFPPAWMTRWFTGISMKWGTAYKEEALSSLLFRKLSHAFYWVFLTAGVSRIPLGWSNLICQLFFLSVHSLKQINQSANLMRTDEVECKSTSFQGSDKLKHPTMATDSSFMKVNDE